MELGSFYIGVLLDAACHLLDLNTIITVHPDPYFEPFEEALIFSETDILEENILITIEVHTNHFYNNINHYYVSKVHSVFHLSFIIVCLCIYVFTLFFFTQRERDSTSLVHKCGLICYHVKEIVALVVSIISHHHKYAIHISYHFLLCVHKNLSLES